MTKRFYDPLGMSPGVPLSLMVTAHCRLVIVSDPGPDNSSVYGYTAYGSDIAR